MVREISWIDKSTGLTATVRPGRSDHDWFLAGVTIRDRSGDVVGWFKVLLDPVLWMDHSSSWHTEDEFAAEEKLARHALRVAQSAIKQENFHNLEGAELFAWPDGSIARVGDKMDESRRKLGAIGVSTSELVRESRVEE